MATNPKSQTRKTLPIDLALQGGGSHGAFTWGVLDRILEEDWFEIDGRQAEASSTSAVTSCLRNTLPCPVCTLVAVMNSLTGPVASASKSIRSVRMSRSGFPAAPPSE